MRLLPTESSWWRHFWWNAKRLSKAMLCYIVKLLALLVSEIFQKKIISWWRRRTSTIELTENAFAFRLKTKRNQYGCLWVSCWNVTFQPTPRNKRSFRRLSGSLTSSPQTLWICWCRFGEQHKSWCHRIEQPGDYCCDDLVIDNILVQNCFLLCNKRQEAHQLVGQAKRRASKIRPKAVGGGSLDRFLQLP